MRQHFLPTLAGLGLALFTASAASAHIELSEPQPRYDIEGFDTGIKSCPCGLGGSNRTCNVAADGSDPARAVDRVSRFEAGSTVTLRFNEYVDHSGRFRVAFDPDGADMGDFNANILADIPDPLNTGGQEWEIQVTLPNMTCDNCTLQLVQAMHGDTENPILDPAAVSSYYTCVDVQLVAPGTLGEEPAAPAEEPAAPAGEPPAGEDEAAAPGDPEAAPEGEAAGDGSEGGGTEVAGNGSETPLIPVGEVPATDATSGPAASPPLAMAPASGAGAPPTAAPVGAPTGVSLDNSGAASSSSGGCGLGSKTPSAGLSYIGFGLLAALAIRRRRPSAVSATS